MDICIISTRQRGGVQGCASACSVRMSHAQAPNRVGGGFAYGIKRGCRRCGECAGSQCLGSAAPIAALFQLVIVGKCLAQGLRLSDLALLTFL